jgi:cytochrome oxidase assembly protein ShyY1
MVGALAFTAACWLILAPWQFHRNAETAAINRAVGAAVTTAPVPVEQHLSTAKEPDESAIYHQVTATGVFDPAHSFYVRLRQDNEGNPASEVVLPMRLDDGTILLVDRGYRSTAEIADSDLPPVPAGRLTVTGRVQQDQTDPRGRPPATVDGRVEVQAVNADALAGMDGTGDNVRRGYIQLVDGSPGVLTAIGMPQIDAGPYLSYALQWCAFGGMSLLAIAFFIYREATDPRGPDEQKAPPPGAYGRPGKDGFDRSQLYD